MHVADLGVPAGSATRTNELEAKHPKAVIEHRRSGFDQIDEPGRVGPFEIVRNLDQIDRACGNGVHGRAVLPETEASLYT